MKLMNESPRLLIIDPSARADILKGLASPSRIQILELLLREQRNINEMAEILGSPQSSVAANIAILEKAGLVNTKIVKAKKGNQKICSAAFEEIIVKFTRGARAEDENLVEVEMPIGLFTSIEATAPCGLCSPSSIIGYLDTTNSFLHPDRMKAGLLWFESGFVEYQFPNDSIKKRKTLEKLEISMELSSESVGKSDTWKSDISLWVNDVLIGTWTAPGDYSDKKGKYTPDWWNKGCSQYGILKRWSVTQEGSFIDDESVSRVVLDDLSLRNYPSIRIRVGIAKDAEHSGGLNLFGRGFGSYDQAIIQRLYFA